MGEQSASRLESTTNAATGGLTHRLHRAASKGKVMRHLKAGKKLGRNTSHRRALLRNLTTSVLLEERIETTVAKAKAVRPHVEKMIGLGKKGDVASRRLAASYIMTREAVEKLFDTIGPRM